MHSSSCTKAKQGSRKRLCSGGTHSFPSSAPRNAEEARSAAADETGQKPPGPHEKTLRNHSSNTFASLASSSFRSSLPPPRTKAFRTASIAAQGKREEKKSESKGQKQNLFFFLAKKYQIIVCSRFFKLSNFFFRKKIFFVTF
jgi:hypothetical protein